MNVWDEIPFLVDYAKRNPPPEAPKRIWFRKRPFIATKKGKAYIEAMQAWELEGLRQFTAWLESRK